MPEPPQQKPNKASQSVIVRLILGLYNSALFVAWFYIFYLASELVYTTYTKNKTQVESFSRSLTSSPIQSINALFGLVPFEKMWRLVGDNMKYAQLAAFIEIFFIIIGWVPSKVQTALLQCSVRLVVIYGAMSTPFCKQNNITGNLVVFAWSISEITRYPFYALNAFLPSGAPYPIVWLRYTAFIFLYPTGLVCEMYLLASTLKGVQATNMWSWTLPNEYNVVFYWPWVLFGLLFAFPPGFLQLYTHMFSQRRKIIGGKGGGAKNGKVKKE